MAPYRQLTPHQCWNVCDWKLPKKTNQAKLSSLFPHAHNESQETHLPTVAITPSKRGTPPLFNLLSYSYKQGGTKEGTGHPLSRGTPFLNCIKISKETDQPTQLRRTCHSLPSPPVTQDALMKTSSLSPELHRFTVPHKVDFLFFCVCRRRRRCSISKRPHMW